MTLHDRPGDVEPEAGPGVLAASLRGEPSLEDALMQLRRNAGALVCHGEEGLPVARAHPHHDGAALGHRLRGVRDEVRRHLPELPLVRRDARGLELEHHVGLRDRLEDGEHRGLHLGGEVARPEVRRRAAVEADEPAEHRAHALETDAHIARDVHELADVGGELLLEELEVGRDRCERVPDLVRELTHRLAEELVAACVEQRRLQLLHLEHRRAVVGVLLAKLLQRPLERARSFQDPVLESLVHAAQVVEAAREVALVIGDDTALLLRGAGHELAQTRHEDVAADEPADERCGDPPCAGRHDHARREHDAAHRRADPRHRALVLPAHRVLAGVGAVLEATMFGQLRRREVEEQGDRVEHAARDLARVRVAREPRAVRQANVGAVARGEGHLEANVPREEIAGAIEARVEHAWRSEGREAHGGEVTAGRHDPRDGVGDELRAGLGRQRIGDGLEHLEAHPCVGIAAGGGVHVLLGERALGDGDRQIATDAQAGEVGERMDETHVDVATPRVAHGEPAFRRCRSFADDRRGSFGARASTSRDVP